MLNQRSYLHRRWLENSNQWLTSIEAILGIGAVILGAGVWLFSRSRSKTNAETIEQKNRTIEQQNRTIASLQARVDALASAPGELSVDDSLKQQVASVVRDLFGAAAETGVDTATVILAEQALASGNTRECRTVMEKDYRLSHR
ncbi:MAG: hypothetical protein CSB44_01145 [Gammaproteobacteria bacterium]|nr:MAG: hypothetical protein CSB44_01145 [Gammaproteobacteria bacterium]